MKDHAVDNSVEQIAMPRIGSGLERLDRTKVGEMIQEIFAETRIDVQVYYIEWPSSTGKDKAVDNLKEEFFAFIIKVKLNGSYLPLIVYKTATGIAKAGHESKRERAK